MNDLKQEKGFTLAETIVAMGLGILLLTAVIGTFQIQQHSYDIQEQTMEMVQTVRAATDMICREVRMAGYNPTEASFDGLPYQAGVLRILADFRGENDHDSPDGDTNDLHEDITYRYDAKTRQIKRNTGGGDQPFAENIETFSVIYLDRQGNPTTASERIRQVKIMITARTAKADRFYTQNGGYRTYSLTARVAPPNLRMADQGG
jgi:type IV pilus assembly protein PilW